MKVMDDYVMDDDSVSIDSDDKRSELISQNVLMVMIMIVRMVSLMLFEMILTMMSMMTMMSIITMMSMTYED